MNIGIIAVDFYPKIGGMENYAAQLATHFKKMGHTVYLFTKTGSQDLTEVENYKILTKNLSVDIPRLCDYDMDVWLAINSSYGILAKHKKNVFICAHGNDFLSPWVRFYFPRLEKSFLWRFKDFLEINYFKFIFLSHIKHIKGIFANSEYTQNRFLDLYPAARNKISVITPGVDEGFFNEHKETIDDCVNILSVARLTNPRKNIDSVIEALSGLKDKYQFKYTIVGDGPLKAGLEEIIRQRNLTDRVFMKGQLTENELKESYQSADLFVLIPKTEKDDIEGFGMVYLEANANGVPVLASRGNGSRSAVKEGVSGYFVDKADSKHCHIALERFLSGNLDFNPKKIISQTEEFKWSNITNKFIKKMGLNENN